MLTQLWVISQHMLLYAVFTCSISQNSSEHLRTTDPTAKKKYFWLLSKVHLKASSSKQKRPSAETCSGGASSAVAAAGVPSTLRETAEVKPGEASLVGLRRERWKDHRCPRWTPPLKKWSAHKKHGSPMADRISKPKTCSGCLGLVASLLDPVAPVTTSFSNQLETAGFRPSLYKPQLPQLKHWFDCLVVDLNSLLQNAILRETNLCFNMF